MKRLVLLFVFLAAPALAQDVVPDLRTARAAYPTPMSKAQLSELLNRVAAQHPGWGLLRKDSGNNCPTPYPGVSVSCDWMVYAPTRWGYDILSDQEGAARVVESGGEALAAGADIVYPWPTTPPDPPPAVPPPPVIVPPVPLPVLDLEPVLRRLEAMHIAQDALRLQLQALDDRVKAHDEETPGWVTRRIKDAKTYVAVAAGLVGYFARGAQ